ncbi:MAG: sodium:solute symporter family protein, partial [Pyramidobacter sp.]|nr:sodium:solute symporter family protein [Pyramidobacter sp.]
SRLTIAGILCAAAVAALTMPGKMLNDLGFLSMGLRAAVVFAPMSAAQFMCGRLQGGCAIAAMLLSPLSMAAVQFFRLPVDPLVVGMGVSVAVCRAGMFLSPSKVR